MDIPDAGTVAGLTRLHQPARPQPHRSLGCSLGQEMNGGARACAFEPIRAAGIGSKASSHETSRYWRCSVTKTGGGASTANAPAWPPPQNAQQVALPCCVLAGAV